MPLIGERPRQGAAGCRAPSRERRRRTATPVLLRDHRENLARAAGRLGAGAQVGGHRRSQHDRRRRQPSARARIDQHTLGRCPALEPCAAGSARSSRSTARPSTTTAPGFVREARRGPITTRDRSRSRSRRRRSCARWPRRSKSSGCSRGEREPGCRRSWSPNGSSRRSSATRTGWLTSAASTRRSRRAWPRRGAHGHRRCHANPLAEPRRLRHHHVLDPIALVWLAM